LENEATQNALNRWKQADCHNKFSLLLSDFAYIRPEPYVPENDPDEDILVSGILEECDIMKSIGLSPVDGRITSGKMVSPKERIHYDSHTTLIELFLVAFLEPVKQWLNSKDNDDGVHQCVGGAFKQHLNWDDHIIEYFMEGMIAWLTGLPHVVLSFWLPFFENALRIQLATFGVDVICHQERTGLEDFVLFDNLLRKAEKHYPIKTVLYWRMIFSTQNGIGWNLRNTFCHGLLPLHALKNGKYVLAVFIAFIYLLAPVPNTDSVDVIQGASPP
jgi:hypothetical protein